MDEKGSSDIFEDTFYIGVPKNQMAKPKVCYELIDKSLKLDSCVILMGNIFLHKNAIKTMFAKKYLKPDSFSPRAFYYIENADEHQLLLELPRLFEEMIYQTNRHACLNVTLIIDETFEALQPDESWLEQFKGLLDKLYNCSIKLISIFSSYEALVLTPIGRLINVRAQSVLQFPVANKDINQITIT